MIPAYMGLIKQIDDQMGRLFAWMEERGLFENTMIVFSSDHGDYLGDHWMGEKDLFHDAVGARAADRLRSAAGSRRHARHGFGRAGRRHRSRADFPRVLRRRAEAAHPRRSLAKPLLHGDGTPTQWREYAISEYDYATRYARLDLGIEENARLIMVCDKRWKYVHCEGFRPMLFDLENDPQELNDLGADPDHEEVRRACTRRSLNGRAGTTTGSPARPNRSKRCPTASRRASSSASGTRRITKRTSARNSASGRSGPAANFMPSGAACASRGRGRSPSHQDAHGETAARFQLSTHMSVY